MESAANSSAERTEQQDERACVARRDRLVDDDADEHRHRRLAGLVAPSSAVVAATAPRGRAARRRPRNGRACRYAPSGAPPLDVVRRGVVFPVAEQDVDPATPGSASEVPAHVADRERLAAAPRLAGPGRQLQPAHGVEQQRRGSGPRSPRSVQCQATSAADSAVGARPRRRPPPAAIARWPAGSDSAIASSAGRPVSSATSSSSRRPGRAPSASGPRRSRPVADAGPQPPAGGAPAVAMEEEVEVDRGGPDPHRGP